MVVAGSSAHGAYKMSGGALYVSKVSESGSLGKLWVRGDGTAEFEQKGSSAVNVDAELNIGTSGGDGEYRLLESETGLSVSTAVVVGGAAYAGRFEWYEGDLDTPELTLSSKGTLAMGFDFSVYGLLSKDLPNRLEPDEVDLEEGTLEVTNNATCTHSSPSKITLGKLDIGSGDGAGAYMIESSTEDQELEADSVFVGYGGNGTLQVGGETYQNDATITITGVRPYYEGQGYKYASICFGDNSTLTFTEPGQTESTCKVVLTHASADFVIKADADGSNLADLGELVVVFEGEDDAGEKTIDMAGEDQGTGLPEEEDFSAANFTIGGLVVGVDDDETGPMTLHVIEGEQHITGEDNEALYVKTLTIKGGGTFGSGTVLEEKLYYDPESPKRLYMADADLSGGVDGADYTAWADNYNQTGTDWSEGDWNGDRTTDGADYTIWADNYGSGRCEGPGPSKELIDRVRACRDGDFDADGDIDQDDVDLLKKLEEADKQP